MRPTVRASSFVKSLAIALCLTSLTSCATSGGKRLNERVAHCQQARQPVPDWPADMADRPAAAIERLGVIADDRSRTRIERECIADL